MPRLRSALTLLLLAGVLAGGVVGWARERRLAQQLEGLPFLTQRGAFLEKENARLTEALAAKQRGDDLLAERRERGTIERSVAGLAELNFLRPVVYREIAREDLPAVLSQKLSQQLPDAEFDHVGLELSALGLIPPGMNLKKVYLDLLGEQIGAFYDQHTHELFTFSGHPLTNSQNQVVMAHELTHALQDQHFDLLKLPLETKGNDDRALAASALVEGDATLVMNSYLTNNLSAAALRDNLSGALSTDVRQLAAAPRYLRETLLFPYLQGLQFATELEARGGRAAIDRAFRDPPSSSSQIMHPEKYLQEPREEPIVVAFGETKVLGTDPAMDNVLGEFTTEQVLETWTKSTERSQKLAAGWRGDRILVYGTPAAFSYVCRSHWRDDAAAREYSLAAAAGLEARYGGNTPAASHPPGESGAVVSEDTVFTVGTRRIRVLQMGVEAVLIDTQDDRWSDALNLRFGQTPGSPHE